MDNRAFEDFKIWFKQEMEKEGEFRKKILNGISLILHRFPTAYPMNRFTFGGVLENLLVILSNSYGYGGITQVGDEKGSIGYDLVISGSDHINHQEPADDQLALVSLKSSFSKSKSFNLTNYQSKKSPRKKIPPKYDTIFVIAEFGFVFVPASSWEEIGGIVYGESASSIPCNLIKKFGSQHPDMLIRAPEIPICSKNGAHDYNFEKAMEIAQLIGVEPCASAQRRLKEHKILSNSKPTNFYQHGLFSW
jgi:hypothetical protein